MEKISNLASASVRSADGSINVEASLTAFAQQLIALRDSEVDQNEAIYLAVETVFDTNRGKTLPMPALTSMAFQLMGADPSTFTVVCAAIGTFVRNNGAYRIGKGKGGGVCRVADSDK